VPPRFHDLADTLGLLVLEVKGWYPKQINKATDQDFELLLTGLATASGVRLSGA
jgi:hypothetical protein